ncbi:MAG: hypothetical protein IPG99_15995 [Ignavibacteria bacterium]|nr:hypothetical protein [Ignavibacteria bacterium]
MITGTISASDNFFDRQILTAKHNSDGVLQWFERYQSPIFLANYSRM